MLAKFSKGTEAIISWTESCCVFFGNNHDILNRQDPCSGKIFSMTRRKQDCLNRLHWICLRTGYCGFPLHGDKVKISMFRHRNLKTEHQVKVIITSLKRGWCRNKINRNIYVFSYDNYFEIALCIFYKLSLETKQMCLGIFCSFLGRRIFQMYEPLFVLKERMYDRKPQNTVKQLPFN